VVSQGQQFKITVRVPKDHYQDVLFRAYVPFDGYPVTLDLSDDEDHECHDLASLEAEIISFLQRAGIKQRLRGIKRLAAVA